MKKSKKSKAKRLPSKQEQKILAATFKKFLKSKHNRTPFGRIRFLLEASYCFGQISKKTLLKAISRTEFARNFELNILEEHQEV